MIEPVFVEYNFNIFLNADYSKHSGSCIRHQVDECSDIHKKYSDTGKMPDTYKLENTTIHQLWWTDNDVKFEDLENQLNMEIKTVSTVCQPPGNIIPVHRYIFYAIKTKEDTTNKHIVRANIYLEDWKPGQFFQYEKDNNWIDSTKWKAGEGLMFDETHIHVSANAGLSNKYTLQLSGYLN